MAARPAAYLAALAMVLLLLAAAASPAHAQRDVFQAARRSLANHNPNERFQACGGNLSNMLHEVCRGFYNPLFTKKSAKDADSDYPWSESSEERLPYPLQALARSSSFFSHGRRQKRQGIYDECCKKPCTYSEARSYCGW